MNITLKRAYEPAAPDDGYRVLIDRLWPRGVTKERAHIDVWAKEVAPGAGLRKSWHADPNGKSDAGFSAFAEAYRAELTTEPASSAVDELVELAREHPRITLVFGAKDETINHAVVLREVLLERLQS